MRKIEMWLAKGWHRGFDVMLSFIGLLLLLGGITIIPAVLGLIWGFWGIIVDWERKYPREKIK